MTKEELAKALDGKEYRKEISSDLLTAAKQNGLVIVYGHSDDLMELEGAIEDEGGCYGGGTFLIDSFGLLPDREDIDDEDELENWFKRNAGAKEIKAVWSAKRQPAWTYKTKIPHATFNVIEGDGDTEVQCRGIVFNISDL
jgi:hypothetical protein